MPKFSIVIPCFNAAKTLGDTLASIQAQTFTDWEVFCVDDGSDDTTRDVINAAAEADNRICLLRNLGKGPSEARNLAALHYAQGEIIAFCDADDLWNPWKLDELVTAFSNPYLDGAFGQIAFFRETPADSTVSSTVPDIALTIPMLLGENPVCTMSNISVRRAIFERSNGFDRSMVHNEDLDWLIRLVGQGSWIKGIKSCQVWYRTSQTGLSADLPAMLEGREQALKTAARFGYRPDGKAHAIQYRYLARRALRLGHGRTTALRFAILGIGQSPFGFFSSPRRGALTLIGALSATIMPAPLSQYFFSR